MDKKVSAGLSLGIILSIAIFIGGFLWFSSYKESKLEKKAGPKGENRIEENISEEKNALENAKVEDWKLISGDPLDNCSSPTYEGKVVIHSWYEWDYIYVEKGWVLKISEDDQNKLPVYYYDENNQPHYSDGAILADADPKLLKQLKSASKTKPVELTVEGFSTYCEGLPSVSLKPGSETFKK